MRTVILKSRYHVNQNPNKSEYRDFCLHLHVLERGSDPEAIKLRELTFRIVLFLQRECIVKELDELISELV